MRGPWRARIGTIVTSVLLAIATLGITGFAWVASPPVAAAAYCDDYRARGHGAGWRRRKHPARAGHR